MKKTLILAVACISTLASVSAMYTPTASLEQKVDRVTSAIETIVETKMDGDYSKLLMALKTFESKVAGDEMKEWILNELMDHAQMKIDAKLEMEATIEEDDMMNDEYTMQEDEATMKDETGSESMIEKEEMKEASDGTMYNGIMFNAYNTVLPAEAVIVKNDSSVMYGDITIDLQAESTEYMGMNTYYLLTEKEASYDVDTYTFLIALEKNEYLKAIFKQSTSAAIGGLPEFRSATLYGQGEEYLAMEWYTPESKYMEILEKLEIGIRS